MSVGYQIEEGLTKKYILSRVPQEEIFTHFLGIPVQYNEFFCSPLRSDKHPTCNFSKKNGKVWYRDWAEANPKDCFNVVQDLYNCNFFEALKIIDKELIQKKKVKTNRKEIVDKTQDGNSKSGKSIIKVKIGRWYPNLSKYLKSYHISKQQCKRFHIYPLSKVWVNGNLAWYYQVRDPALGYYFGKSEKGEERWKIYFFQRDKYRFLTNTNRINGWYQLPDEGKNLIITKSLKDVVCLDTLGVPSIAMQNETTIPYDYIIKELKDRFANLYSFYDFDRTGVINANKLKKLYNIPYMFLTDGRFGTKDYKEKDISDYIQHFGLEAAEKFMKEHVSTY